MKHEPSLLFLPPCLHSASYCFFHKVQCVVSSEKEQCYSVCFPLKRLQKIPVSLQIAEMTSPPAWLPVEMHWEATGNHISPPVTARLGAGAVLIGKMSKGNCQVISTTENQSVWRLQHPFQPGGFFNPISWPCFLTRVHSRSPGELLKILIAVLCRVNVCSPRDFDTRLWLKTY